MSNYQIFPFSQYVLRTPAFPLSVYLDLLENYSSEKLLLFFDVPFLKEAIRIASPDLLLSLNRWKENPESLSREKSKSLELTLLKYAARIASRCTPFGLFAGCSVGDIAPETAILMADKQDFTRFTQFDMHFWVALLQEYAKRESVRNHLTYYPNSSIYTLGDFYRFVEYKYVRLKREYSIVALRKSELLEDLFVKAKSGITIDEMVLLLADDESEHAETLEFINQLIDFQFLVSELDAVVTGSDEWGRFSAILDKVPTLKEDTDFLKTIKKEFEKLDASIVPSEETYENIKSLLQKTGVEFDEKYLFQTDLNSATSENTLAAQVPKKVAQALRFLNGIQEKRKPVSQVNFVKAFHQRYESRTMPLTTVLDTEIGIGYLQNSEMNDTHSLLEKFSFKSKVSKEERQFWTTYDYVLEKKMQECLLNQEVTIQLSEQDFPDFDADLAEAPATFSVMIEVAKERDNELIAIDYTGDSSAAKLLGRFCNGNHDIHALTRAIIDKEMACHSNKLFAEIVHIPESRTGNILRRPVLRDFEIAYLSNPGVANDAVLALSDLTVAIEKDAIVLRSKKHNKQVIPCLSNAHNFSNKSLPIYHFLCDLQAQDVKPIYGFSWGTLVKHYTFFPRVVYHDVILAKAKWMVTKSEIEKFQKMEKSLLFETFSAWRTKRNIPKYVNWVQFDNTLLFDFEKEICIQLFLKSVQNFESSTLEEFLFANTSVVKAKDGEYFTNQFILPFYKQNIG